MGFMDKMKSWWRQGEREDVAAEAPMSDSERESAEEDWAGHQADTRMESGYYQPGGAADFERDSERPH